MVEVTEALGRTGVVPAGEYSASKTYNFLDLVFASPSTYISRKDNNTGHPVTDPEWWQLSLDGSQSKSAAEAARTAAQVADASAKKADAATEAADRAATGAVEAAETADVAAECAREAADAVVWLRARPVLLEIEKNAEGDKTIRVTVHGLEPGIPLSEYEVRLFREGVFRRVKGKMDGSGSWVAAPPTRGWVHPQHLNFWNSNDGYSDINPKAGPILSRFTLTSPEKGGLIPTGYSDTPVTWQDLFGGCFKVARDNGVNTIRVAFGTTQKTVRDLWGMHPIVMSFPIRNRVALALYHNGKRVSNMATVSLSFTVTSEGWKGANTVYRGYVNRI